MDKIDKFGDFLCDIDYSSRTDVSRDVITLIINPCDPRRTKCVSGGHKVFASPAAQASEAHLYTIMDDIFETRYEVNHFCNNSHCTTTLISIRIYSRIP